MDSTLIDRETLGQFVDELIKKQSPTVNSLEELDTLREKNITALDNRISMAIFDQLTKSQNAELNLMFDQEEEPSEDDYKEFFKKSGIDLEKTITNTMQNYAIEFLGGQNVGK